MNANDAGKIARELPYNIELEQALLGAIFWNNDAFHQVSDFLEAQHFYEPLHGEIFKIVAQLIGDGKCATLVTVKTFLPNDIKVAKLTIDEYLARLAAEATSVINARDYARNIRDLAGRRELVLLGQDIANAASTLSATFLWTRSSIELSGIFALSVRQSRRNWRCSG
jgi:replicative DNA helicase